MIVVAVSGLFLPSSFCCSASAARKAVSAAPVLSARLARVPAAISSSNWPTSPELNACAARRCASSASAAELTGAAFGFITPASTPIERSMTLAAGSTPSAYQTLPPTSATIATCGQPPTRRVHCSSSAGLLLRIVVAVGGSQRNRVSSPSRHGLAVTSCASCALPAASGAHARAGLLPGAAIDIRRARFGRCLRAVLADRVLADRDLRRRLRCASRRAGIVARRRPCASGQGQQDQGRQDQGPQDQRP